MTTFELVDYFDVWGNEEDGFQVNNAMVIGRGIDEKVVKNKRSIMKYLKDTGFLKTDARGRDIIVTGYDEFIEVVENKNHYPLCCFQVERKPKQ
jgi:hypothetical protein